MTHQSAQLEVIETIRRLNKDLYDAYRDRIDICYRLRQIDPKAEIDPNKPSQPIQDYIDTLKALLEKAKSLLG